MELNVLRQNPQPIQLLSFELGTGGSEINGQGTSLSDVVLKHVRLSHTSLSDNNPGSPSCYHKTKTVGVSGKEQGGAAECVSGGWERPTAGVSRGKPGDR